MSEPEVTEYKGQCACGSVRFSYAHSKEAEPVFSVICHCLNCRRVNGSSPHLFGIPKDAFSITQGEDVMKTYDITDKFQRSFCSKCGVGVMQAPAGRGFVATFPTLFDEARQKFPKDVPDMFQVKGQVNCENAWSSVFIGSKNVAPRYRVFGTDPHEELIEDENPKHSML